ncbi:hypothetical protein LZ30DRAFT_276575 [Colletotrichum cereale]|nr:hypothetical protein LZ30DRAFT_276575 [Colletotrichum cereale]
MFCFCFYRSFYHDSTAALNRPRKSQDLLMRRLCTHLGLQSVHGFIDIPPQSYTTYAVRLPGSCGASVLRPHPSQRLAETHSRFAMFAIGPRCSTVA